MAVEPSPPTAPTSDASTAWLDGALVLAVVGFAFLLGSFSVRHSDFWLHLATGRLIVNGQYIWGTDPFCYTSEGRLWVNHAWLFDTVLFAIYRAANGAGVVVARAILVSALAGIMLLIRRPGRGFLLPAVGTCLALLALSPRLLLQPTLVSYLCLALLLFFLHCRPKRMTTWQLPTAVGYLFAVWVNCDAWFVLGPATLAIWLFGVWLQEVAPASVEAEPAEAGWSVPTLAIALAVGLAACLLNPHHFHAFALPVELLPLSSDLAGDRVFESLTLSPFSNLYFARAGLVAVWSYFLLLGLGFVSFAINFNGWRWGRAFVWLALAWLSTQQSRAIPFFAVVGGPLMALNLQAALMRWLAARPPADAQTATTRSVMAITGRTAALLTVIGLMVATWPGWIGIEGLGVRRVDWRVEADPTLERLMLRLNGLSDSSALSQSDRAFAPTPDVCHYCAWFCPRIRNFFDYRLSLFPRGVAEDFAHIRRSLSARSDPQKTEPDGDLQELFAKYGVTFLIMPGGDNVPAFALYAGRDPAQWPAWCIAGRGAIFGWNDPAKPLVARQPDPRLDLGRLAFSPGAETVPSRTVIEPPAPPPTGFEAFRATPITTSPPEAVETLTYLALRDGAIQRSEYASMVWQVLSGLGYSAATAGRTAFLEPFAVSQVMTSDPRMRLDFRPLFQVPAAGSPSAVGAVLLAVRAARRGIIAAPDLPEAYMGLAQAYHVQPTIGPWQRLQQITALRQTLARLPSPGDPRSEKTAYDIHRQLFDLYTPRDNKQPVTDLMVTEWKEVVRRMPLAMALARVSKEQADGQMKQAEQQTKALEEQLRKRTDAYELKAAEYKNPQARVQLAAGYGLPEEALRNMVFNGQVDPKLIVLCIQLLLEAGRAEEARAILMSPAFNPVTVLQPEAQPTFQALNVEVAAVLGDYERALVDLGSAQASTPRSLFQPMRFATGPGHEGMIPAPLPRILQAMFLPDMTDSMPLTRLGFQLLSPEANRAFEQIVGILQQDAALHIQRAILALESGDVALARRQLDAAVNPIGPRFDFPNRAAAEQYLSYLNLYKGQEGR